MDKKKKKSLIIYSIIVSSALVVGGLGGFLAKRYLGQEITDESTLDPNDYKMDTSELMDRYNSFSGTSYDKEFTAAEMINIALEKYRTSNNCYSYGIGVAHAKSLGINIEQSIRNSQIKNGDVYFEESISKSSMVGVATRAIQNGASGDIELYFQQSTSKVTSEKAVFDMQATIVEHNAYRQAWGKTLDEMFIYIISNKTVESKNITRDGTYYLVEVNLYADIAAYNYKTQMVTISNLDGRPTFDSINLKYTLSSQLDLLQLHCDEKYQASMGVNANIHNEIDYYYHVDSYLQIPEINESFDYSMKGE